MTTRRCPRCGYDKPLEAFGTYKDSRRGTMVQGYCRPCMAAAKYEKVQERVEWIRDLLRRSSCLRCGKTDYRVLRFHHRDPAQKLCNVYKATNSWKQLRAEIAKCDIICADCHAIEHCNW